MPDCADWQFFTPVAGEWAPLPEGEKLEPPRFMLQMRRTPETAATVAGMPPAFEFLLNDATDGAWAFMREVSIQVPLERIAISSPLGIRVTAPEVLLLHKAWHPHRPKDEHDFARVRDLLSADQRAWLKTHLERIRPDDPWLPQLV